MSLFATLLSWLADAIVWLIVTIFGTPARRPSGAVQPDRHFTPPTSDPIIEADGPRGTPSEPELEVSHPPDYLQRRHDRTQVMRQQEDGVSDSFLSQLEQRTQQVKITLANLEAEKVRIEGLIAQLQPIVPHYDALLAAERQLSETAMTFDAPAPAAVAPANAGADSSWEREHQPPQPTTPTWETASWNQ